MFTRALLTDAFREIRKSPARFASIFAIVAIGVGLFVGIKGAAPNMKYTADQYYDQYQMMDIRVLSTLGLVPEDISAIKATEGVDAVQPGYFTDVTTMVDSTEYVLRVHSIPGAAIAGQLNGDGWLNEPRLVSGRMPTGPGEAVVEENRNVDLGIGLGDTISVTSGKKEDLSNTLRTTDFTVVGKVVSPYYLTFQREPSDIGSGRVNLFMMVSEDEFLYPVYTEALVTVAGARELDSYSQEYSRLVQAVTNRLDNLGTERAALRLESLKAQAQQELDSAKAELAAREAEYDQQIRDGEAQLLAASNELAAGRAAIDQGRADLATQMAAYQQMISQMEPMLAQAESQVAQLQSQYGPLLDRLAGATGSISDGIAQLQQVQADSTANIATLEGLLASPNLTDEQRSVLAAQLDREHQILDGAGRALAASEGLSSDANTQVAAAQGQLQAASAQAANARYQLNQAQYQMATAQANAEAEFAAAEERLAAGQQEYDAAKAEFERQKAEGADAIQDGRERLIRAENEIERLTEPTWYVLDRSKIYSYADYAATADRMDAIAALFPVFFFAVAALVSLTTMTRMIDEQRTALGAYKALGYSGPAIAFKYVSYAAIASLLGGLVGGLVGIRVLPKVIFDSWAMMYELPEMQQVNHVALIVGSALLATVLMTVTAYLAVRNELRAVPATLMRPKAPAAGKVILLERIAPLWSRLSFSQKVTMRNIFRYKKRFFMTVLGVAGCAALLVAGLGLSDSIGQIVPRQYGQIFTHDMAVRLSATIDERQRQAAVDQLNADKAVAGTLPLSQFNATVRDGDEEIAATLTVPLDEAEFPDFVKLRHRAGGQSIALPASGVVISEQLGSDLGVGPGDTISVDIGTGVIKKYEVSALTENYLFHQIYMSPEAYRELYRHDPEISGIMIQLNDVSAQDRLGSALIESGQASSVTYYSDISDKFAETIVSLNTIVWAMIIAAGLLAFVVLYNLTNINLSERIREIATIKVLGFYHREVAAYVYREIFLLTLIGALVGLGVGVGLHRAIMVSIEQDDVMFGNYVSGLSFAYAVGITLLFGVLVAVFMYRKLINIKMVESLKSVE